MDLLHLCRLCLKTSGYHFNVFTEIISNKHLYQFINNICELEVFRNDGYPEHICENCFQSIGNIICFKTQAKDTEAALTRMIRFRNIILTKQKEEEKEEDNEEAVDPAFDHITVNQNSIKNEIEADGMIIAGQENGSGLFTELAIKSEIDIDEIAFPAEQVEIEKNKEMEESASWKKFKEMENIPAMIEKSESQEEEVSAISLDGNASPDEDKILFQEVAIKSEIDIDKIAIPAEQVQIEKITEMKATTSSEHFSEMEIIQAGIETFESQEFSEDRRRMECHHCGEKRETKQEIVQHIVDAHNSIFYEDNTPIQQQKHDKKHTCSMCERRFKNKSDLARHMQNHTRGKPFQCNICNYRCARSGSLKVHMQTHTGEKPFQCNICNYSCARSGQLQRHSLMHTGERPFHCNICNYNCSQSGSLKVHMRTHTGEKPFQCNICNYRCARSEQLQRHSRMHTGERPFHCNICNYRCSQSGSLKVHIRTHTGEKPFHCNICNYRCARSEQLQRHSQMHTGEKRFHCNICNYKCSQTGSLKVHMRTHTGEKPFHCNICNYRCARSEQLQRHSRIHTGEKRFHCNICNYRCSQSGLLKVHMGMHTGEKPFQCNICNYSCSESGSLNVHNGKHTSENDEKFQSKGKVFRHPICIFNCLP